ncbi:MAG TPA: hypothetical protein VFB66_21070 [Tepidisphaeraceae bacterium]|nr:hypothetical protein [Tepidisphaeraceae bacterium]
MASLHLAAGLCLCACVLAGCGSAVRHGRSTALDSVDLVRMTDDMAMKIIADAEVQQAIGREGSLKVVVQPVENMMTAEVLPRGPAETFTARVRSLLSRHAPDRFTWVMNRDAFYRLRERELDVDLGPSPDAISPEYALVARFSSITDESPKHRSSYYLCVYELFNLEDRSVLWTDKYEVKKSAVKGFLD